MRFRVELSDESHEQLTRFPRDVRARIERAIDELEAKDEAQWSNVKALHGPAWKGRLRKKVGPYRIVFRKYQERGALEISAILIRSKDTYQ
ncbi:MAG: type II toxin-antitoxin system RelE/ParE family toxin [Bryobacteraceae bacterium]|jgi:mRNA-degrading endonuclease RelE of RelBE toxin-antitoxin system